MSQLMDTNSNNAEPPPSKVQSRTPKNRMKVSMSQVVPLDSLSYNNDTVKSNQVVQMQTLTEPDSHRESSNKTSNSQKKIQDINEKSGYKSGSSLNSADQARLKSFAQRFLGKVGASGQDDEEVKNQTKITEDWVDPTPNLIEGIFSVNQTNICKRCCSKEKSDKPDKIVVYDQRALFFLHFENRVRIELVAFTSSNLFENFIILLIFANTVVLAIYDYNDRENLTDFNMRLEIIGQVFTILFTVEMVLKILAQGLIIHKNAYLRDAWNWLDFIVVVTGILEMTEISWFKVRALRTLRVLRPLRSIKAFPTMRRLISSLIGSVNSLLNAVVFMLFIFILFGILGIQQFGGSMYRRCRFTEFPLEDGTWPFDPDLDYLCSPDGQGLMECPANRYCKEPGDADLSPDIDDPFAQPLILYNMLCFDNLAWALLTIFQMITLESWTIVMYNLMDSNIWWMAIIFSVSIVIIGSFLLLNVILAVLADALTMVEEVQERQDQTRLLKIKRSLDRADAQYVKQGFPPMYQNKNRLDEQEQNEKKKLELQGEENKNDNDQYVNLGVISTIQPQVEDDNSKNQESSPNNAAVILNQTLNVSRLDPALDANTRNNGHTISGSHEDISNLSCDERIQKSQENQETPQRSISMTQIDDNDVSNIQNKSEIKETKVIEENMILFDSQSIPTESKAPKRAQNNKLYYWCYVICTHWIFTLFITILIIANTFVLASEKYPETASMLEIVNIFNEFFTWSFVAELIIKLIGLGFRDYARDSFNLFDALIVVLSIVDMVVTALIGAGKTDMITAFRGVRLLRVFKLARSWETFRKILTKIIDTMKHTAIFSVLLLMFALIFCLLGMELFGHNIRFNAGQVVAKDEFGLSPRPNFDNLGMAFTSVFAIAIGDDWNLLMAQAFRNEGVIAIIFYPVVFCAMTLILLSLFLAILLEKFGIEDPEESKEDQEEKSVSKFSSRIKYQIDRLGNGCEKHCPCCFLKEMDSEEEPASDSDDQDPKNPFDEALPLDKDLQPCEENIYQDSLQQEERKSLRGNKIKRQQIPIILEADSGKEASSHNSQLYEDSNHQNSNYDDRDAKQNMMRVSQPHSPFQSNENNEQIRVISGQVGNQHENDYFSGEKVDKPANQQDAGEIKIPVIDHNYLSPVLLKQASIKSQNTSEKASLRKSQTNNQLVSQNKKLTKANQKSISEMIPEQFNREQFLIIVAEKLEESKSKNESKSQQIKKKRDIFQSTAMFLNAEKRMSLAEMKKLEQIERLGEQKKEIKIVGRSCFIFSPQNWLRQICHKIVKQGFYDTAVLILIAVSTILLTMDDPNMDPNGTMAIVLSNLDYVLTTLFTLESIINIIVLGFYCNGKTSYARDPWNIMDLLIVIFSLLTIVLASTGGAADLSILKIFRMLRVLRPLRVLKRNLGLKIQVISLMNSIPGVTNLLVISNLILLIFGIQAIGLLKGKLFICDMTSVPEYVQDRIQTKWDCLDYGGEWINQSGNFDNIINAQTTLFGMMMTEGWMDVMWHAVDSTNVHQVPLRNNNPAFIFFFMFFMIIGTLFILNLFIGVVINTFDKEKEKLSHNNLMTDLQDEYCEAVIKCYTSRPARAVIQTGSKIRDICQKIAQHQAFEIAIFICICLNTVQLSLAWYQRDDQITKILIIFNYIFTGIYTLEMIIKMTAYGKGYFSDGWNNFDFLIVVSAWLGILLLQVFNIDLGSVSTIIRSFRIARVLKLIKAAKNLQQIFQTFILAIPEMINVGLLLILFLFLFAVLGVSLFAQVKLQENLNRHANFQSFGLAILTLLRVATGESWNGIMYDCARKPSINFSCIVDQSYDSKELDGIQGCGTNITWFYYLAFILMVSLVFLNLFIAIILEGFAASATEQKVRVGDDCQEAFTRVWRKYDPFALGMIDIRKLEHLILDLIVEELEEKNKNNTFSINFNLHRFKALNLYTKWKRDMISEEEGQEFFKNWEKNFKYQRYLRRQMDKFIISLQIPLYFDLQKIQFHDTFNGIIRVAYQLIHESNVDMRELAIETKKRVGEELGKLEKIQPGSHDFWQLSLRDREQFLEEIDPDFQKIVNRLENKGNEDQDQAILKLNYMRRLRKQTGTLLAQNLSIFEGLVYDSSHYMGASTIEFFIIEMKERKEQKLRNIKLQKENRALRNSKSSLSDKRNSFGNLISQTSDELDALANKQKITLQDNSLSLNNTFMPLMGQTQVSVHQTGQEQKQQYRNIPLGSAASQEWINKIEDQINSLSSKQLDGSDESSYVKNDNEVSKINNIQLDTPSKDRQILLPAIEKDYASSQLNHEDLNKMIEECKEIENTVYQVTDPQQETLHKHVGSNILGSYDKTQFTHIGMHMEEKPINTRYQSSEEAKQVTEEHSTPINPIEQRNSINHISISTENESQEYNIQTQQNNQIFTRPNVENIKLQNETRENQNVSQALAYKRIMVDEKSSTKRLTSGSFNRREDNSVQHTNNLSLPTPKIAERTFINNKQMMMNAKTTNSMLIKPTTPIIKSPDEDGSSYQNKDILVQKTYVNDDIPQNSLSKKSSVVLSEQAVKVSNFEALNVKSDVKLRKTTMNYGQEIIAPYNGKHLHNILHPVVPQPQVNRRSSLLQQGVLVIQDQRSASSLRHPETRNSADQQELRNEKSKNVPLASRFSQITTTSFDEVVKRRRQNTNENM